MITVMGAEVLQAQHLGNHWMMSTSMGEQLRYATPSDIICQPQLVDINRQYSVGLLGKTSLL